MATGRGRRSRWDRAKGGLWSGSRIDELTPDEVEQLEAIAQMPGWQVLEGLIADLLGQSVAQLVRCKPDEHDYYRGRYQMGVDIINAPRTAAGAEREADQEVLTRLDPAARGWLAELQSTFCRHHRVERVGEDAFRCRACKTIIREESEPEV